MNVSFLLPLYEHDGPFATAYLDTTKSTEDGVRLVELRWRALRDGLEAQNVPADVLDLMATAVAERMRDGGADHERQAVLVLVANRDGVLFNEHVAHALTSSRASWDQLPDLFPLVAMEPPTVPHIVAAIDRKGADLTGYAAERAERAEHLSVAGDDYPITKVAPGGWSQRRFQQRAENVWVANAHEVADEMAAMAGRIHSRLIVVSGDVRAKAEVLDALPPTLREQVVEVPGGRAPGSDRAETRVEIDRAVAEDAARLETELLASYAQELGRHGRAVQGLQPAVEALARGQVEHLFITTDGLEQQIAIGEKPMDLAVEPTDLPKQSDPVSRVRADAALVRAAAGSGSEVHAIDPARLTGSVSWPDGERIGALLRYAA